MVSLASSVHARFCHAACPAYHIILVLITLIVFGEEQDLRVWVLDVRGLYPYRSVDRIQACFPKVVQTLDPSRLFRFRFSL
jgi:hypothetical protein